MTNLTVVATVIAKPGQEAATEPALSALVAPTRLEAGCLRYDLHRDLADPRRFVFYEIWESQAALDRHLASAHFGVFKERIPELVETLDVRLLELISAP